mgnify:CR=1 FL=1
MLLIVFGDGEVGVLVPEVFVSLKERKSSRVVEYCFDSLVIQKPLQVVSPFGFDYVKMKDMLVALMNFWSGDVKDSGK